jgi:hypothetical protein
VNPNYNVAPRAAVVGHRLSPFRLMATVGSLRRLPSSATSHARVTSPSLALLLAYLGAHAVLGIAMKKIPALATTHALLSFLVAIYWAATSRGQSKVITAVCYLAAAEVTWRMARASVFWEFGKYAVCAVLLVAMWRHRPPRLNSLALIYFGLLIPSTLLTCVVYPDFGTLRKAISSPMSGPLAMTLCSIYFFRAKLTTVDQGKLLLAILGPVVGMGAVCALGTASLGSDYVFSRNSNDDTSGGFGPNQVSATFGWGILAAFFWMQRQRKLSSRWWLALVLILFFAAQAALTFSRTGIWLGLITIGAASIFTIRDPRKFISTLIGALLVVGIFYFVIFQSLDEFTGHKLSERYTQKGFGNREDLARNDLMLAWRNPLFGVGAGMTRIESTKQLGIRSASHTEFTRLLAEHGLTGLLALGALLAMGAKTFKSASTPSEQSWTTSFLAYSMLFMLVSGMRLVVPAVSIGLSMSKLQGGTKPLRISGLDRTRRAERPGLACGLKPRLSNGEKS